MVSPNFDPRPDDMTVDLLVIHSISLPPGEFGGDAIERLFTNQLDPKAHPYYREIALRKVSAHFLIRRDGVITQFVSAQSRAWHAGVSRWGVRERCNDFSIGVELEGTDDVAFTDCQYDQLAALAHVLKQSLPIHCALGHSDIAPGRKTDPGPQFDWKRFRAATDIQFACS